MTAKATKTPVYTRHPFLLAAQDVAAELNTDLDKGLTALQVAKLSQEYPRNELEVEGAIPWYKILLRQLFNAMIIVLFMVLTLSFAFRDFIEGSVLAVVIALNVAIGFWQEKKAEKKMDSLRALSSPSAMVIRDGKSQVIPNPDVVPGDIVVLKMGDTVPADLRLFEAMNLNCDEQTMTGESLPVEKVVDNNILDPETAELAIVEENVKDGDRINLAFASTIVRKGRGRGIVIATGMATAVGKIAAASTKKVRKPGRSMNALKYGIRQPFVGGFRRVVDFIGRFLGLTEGTPLQRKLAWMAYGLLFAAVILTIVVFGVHDFKIDNEVIIYAMSTGIAIIPESLVAVLTITMVQATNVMRKSNVVVRDLSALEALGGVTNICSDKTGTLTQGAMIVKKVWLPMSRIFTVRGSTDPDDPTQGTVTVSKPKLVADSAHTPRRDFDQERSASSLRFDVPDDAAHRSKKPNEEPQADLSPDLRMFLLSSALCNVSTVRQDRETQKWQTTGEPTEIALQVFAHRFDLGKRTLVDKGWKQLAEFQFDSTIKRMSVIYDAPADDYQAHGDIDSSNSLVFTKGAVERIVDLCSTVGIGAAQEAMTDELKEEILAQVNEFASMGQRVLAIAYRPWHGKFEKPEPQKIETAGNEENLVQQDQDLHAQEEDQLRGEVETSLTLLGLAGIYDPPRKETAQSIRECSNAGIGVHMLTGDHPATAEAIAKEVGILPHNLGTLPEAIATTTVQQATLFDRMSDAEIDALPELPLVIARCAPETKTRMIEALRRRNAYMAMTGDGVNDAPSLSRADVGIAMGSGSDVAKSAAKIVLTDDKFDSIVAAIREGRRMFDNTQKFILHLLTSNVGEVILLIAGLGFKDRDARSVFPISPLGILWINMLTSSFPAFGLGREAAAPGIMRKPPHSRGVFTREILVDMLVYGTVMGACTLLTFFAIVYGVGDGELGHDCNRRYSAQCDTVFRARAAVFAELAWLILLSAWEFKDMRRSMFRLNPDSPYGFPRNVAADLWKNQVLFWSVLLGTVSVFLTIYAPYLNQVILKHTAISWEWGLVFVGSVLFVSGVEIWKLVKNKFDLFKPEAAQPRVFAQGSEEGQVKSFLKSMSLPSFISGSSFSKSKSKTGSW